MTENKKGLLDFYKENVHVFYNIDYIITIYDKKGDYKDASIFFKNLKQILESQSTNDINIKNEPNIEYVRENVKDIIYELFGKLNKKKEITLDQFHEIVKKISESLSN